MPGLKLIFLHVVFFFPFEIAGCLCTTVLTSSISGRSKRLVCSLAGCKIPASEQGVVRVLFSFVSCCHTAIKQWYKLTGRVVNECHSWTIPRGSTNPWDPSLRWCKPQQPPRVTSSTKKPQQAFGSHRFLCLSHSCLGRDISVMDTLWSELALGSSVSRWGAGYPRRPCRWAGSGDKCDHCSVRAEHSCLENLIISALSLELKESRMRQHQYHNILVALDSKDFEVCFYGICSLVGFSFLSS